MLNQYTFLLLLANIKLSPKLTTHIFLHFPNGLDDIVVHLELCITLKSLNTLASCLLAY
ncbi:MAG: hypothetical protein RL226_2035 [Bacteroidota bacterium]|jgi:hypothetical protein